MHQATLASCGPLALQPGLPRTGRAPARNHQPVLDSVPLLTPLRYEPASGSATRLMAAMVLSLHLLGCWALLQLTPVRDAVRKLAPMVVSIVSAPARPDLPKPLPLPPPPQATPQRVEPSSLIPVFQLASAAPSPVAAVAAVTSQSQSAVASQTELVTPVTPSVLPPQPPAPKQIAASAVRYLLAPPVEVPMLSRRAGESGVVLLRVLVDAQGLPKQIQLHKSSGFARLDEQALGAMRQARFKPQTENGQAIEWFVIAPLSYELDR